MGRGESHLCGRCRRGIVPAVRAVALPRTARPDAPPPHVTQAFFILPFEGPSRALVHALKYGRRVSAARALVELSAPALESLPLGGVDLVVPIPLHRVRHRERGFNQAALLATELGGRAGVPVLGGLLRTRATVDQTHLPRDGRLANVRGAFVGVHDLVEGARVLLVDDVVTTGATLSEAASELRRVGAESVVCLAVAGREAAQPVPGSASRRTKLRSSETG